MTEKKCKWCQKPISDALKYCDKSCRRKARAKRKKEEIELNANGGKPIIAKAAKMESVFCACKEFKDTGKGRCASCDKTPNIATRKKLDAKSTPKQAGLAPSDQSSKSCTCVVYASDGEGRCALCHKPPRPMKYLTKEEADKRGKQAAQNALNRLNKIMTAESSKKH